MDPVDGDAPLREHQHPPTCELQVGRRVEQVDAEQGRERERHRVPRAEEMDDAFRGEAGPGGEENSREVGEPVPLHQRHDAPDGEDVAESWTRRPPIRDGGRHRCRPGPGRRGAPSGSPVPAWPARSSRRTPGGRDLGRGVRFDEDVEDGRDVGPDAALEGEDLRRRSPPRGRTRAAGTPRSRSSPDRRTRGGRGPPAPPRPPRAGGFAR